MPDPKVETLGGIAALDRASKALSDEQALIVERWLYRHAVSQAVVIKSTCPGEQPKPYIVMREAVEAAARVFYEGVNTRYGGGPEWGNGGVALKTLDWLPETTVAALAALGPFEVADETCNIVSKRVMLELTRVIPDVPDVDESCVIELHRGDHIYIKRRESEEG